MSCSIVVQKPLSFYPFFWCYTHPSTHLWVPWCWWLQSGQRELEELGIAFQQHLKTFTLTSMTPILRGFFSFSPPSSFYSPASILRFSNMISHLALFFMAPKLQITFRFIKYGASNIYQLFVCSLLTLKNSSAQLQVCSSLTDHLTLHMFPNYKKSRWDSWTN